MDNATQYQFELTEVAELLIKKQGLKDGLWMIGVGFNLSAVMGGPDQTGVRPAMIVAVDTLILTRVEAIGPLTFDAALIAV